VNDHGCATGRILSTSHEERLHRIGARAALPPSVPAPVAIRAGIVRSAAHRTTGK
jgi:hypothetical protein